MVIRMAGMVRCFGVRGDGEFSALAYLAWNGESAS